MSKTKLKMKILIILVVIFTTMLITISGGVGWWRYSQYQQEQEKNQAVMTNTLNDIIHMHKQELAFLGEAIIRNKNYLSTSKCYVKYLTNKNIKRCAKKTLKLAPKDQTPERLLQLFPEQISSEANNTNNYFTTKNPHVKVFDLLFTNEIIWSQNKTNFNKTKITSLLFDQARETKKSAFGVEKNIDNQLYLFGIFAHFNPKEYYFSRIGIEIQQLIEELIASSNADMGFYGTTKLFSTETEEKSVIREKTFNTDFEGFVTIQDWHFVYKIPISIFGNTESPEYFFVVKNGKEELLGSLKGFGMIIVGITVIMLASVIFLMIFFSRSITRPLNQVITELSKSSENVSLVSNNISSSNIQLADGASNQAASIEETSSSLEEMSSMIKKSADNSKQADNLMEDANEVVDRANVSMSELILSMEEISKASEETSKIIKTIDEIAFQTNLLALNAAVEAARAGEVGAGFAVVADEVRNLAMRAADAAKNTEEMIKGTVNKINAGSELVTEANESFAQVSANSSKVGTLIGEISEASSEQALGIEQVNKAVIELDKVVQQNAATAEESASASEEMKAQAEQMKTSVGKLEKIVGESDNGHDLQKTVNVARNKAHNALPAPAKKNESG